MKRRLSDWEKWVRLVLVFLAAVGLVVAGGVLVGAFTPARAAQGCSLPDPAARPVVRLASGELRALAALAWGEARGEPNAYCSMQAVAAVVVNRIRRNPRYFGATITQVINRPYAFSVFGRTDPNKAKMAKVDESDPLYIAALLAAISAVGGADPVGGADHFFAGSRPGWARTMTQTARIGAHTFMRSP